MLTMMLVLDFPPMQSWSNLVSFESLHGIKEVFLELSTASAAITFPSELRERLMNLASSNCCRLGLVLFVRSLPARSTQVNFDLRIRLTLVALLAACWKGVDDDDDEEDEDVEEDVEEARGERMPGLLLLLLLLFSLFKIFFLSTRTVKTEWLRLEWRFCCVFSVVSWREKKESK